MTEHYDIAGYTRISVDDELDRDNVSIENQKAIIRDFVKPALSRQQPHLLRGPRPLRLHL